MDDLQATHRSCEMDKTALGTSQKENGGESPAIIRFGVYEADLRTGELRRAGIRIRLQDQPFQVLTLLISRPGQIVSRAEIIERLWGNNTFVDFDQSVGAVIRKLRLALGDSAIVPRYIETIRHKGYRFLPPTHTDAAAGMSRPEPASPKRRLESGIRGPQPWIRFAATTAAALALLMWSGRLLRTSVEAR